MSEAAPRPYRATLILAVVTEAAFALNLTRPHKLVFDETHYVPAARTLLALAGPVNTEHPLIGKIFIAAGIALFGDNAFGWRFFSTLAGTAIVLGLYAILWMLFGRVRTAALGAIFALLNFTLYIQARIAMLDVFMMAFLTGAIAAMLWAAKAPDGKAWRRWLLGAALLGVACGGKWAAAPYLGFAGLAFLVVRIRDARIEGYPVIYALRGRGARHWPGIATIPGLAALGTVTILVYFLTFLPAFFYHDEQLTLGTLLPFQAGMYAEQTQILPHHPYQSDWWSWPFMIRPIWYLYERADGAIRGVLMIGNPAILWGGLIAVLACLWGAWRDRSLKLLGIASLWAGSYAMFAIIPKHPSFFYYYFPSSVFLSLALAAALDRFGKGRLRNLDESFTIVAAGLFIYFYPILSAAALSGPQAFRHWMWFSTWP
jgi:dolichyl-phosphate-mannose--protein O-mannosyl transferase